MRNADKWRRAMLDRAVALNIGPGDVVAEFVPLVNDPPDGITQAEARALAKVYPYSAKEIKGTFTRREP